MYPELFTIPIVGLSVKTYGFCLMLGFLSAVWFAMRRAERVKANPDTVLDMAFLALIFGVGGARLFYVAHYWQPRFAGASNKFLAIIDIREGGLEFLGGFLGAFAAIMVYAAWKKVSIRMYLDILAPGAMWGLAFGRLGCFFNGCCFGGLCLAAAGQQAGASDQVLYPWGVEFPFASPAHWRQWEDREVTVPAELISTYESVVQPSLLPALQLSMSVEKRERPRRLYEEAAKAYETAKALDPDSQATATLQENMARAQKAKEAREKELLLLLLAQQHPSRIEPKRGTSVSELELLASDYRSRPVHPTQLYSSIHALLLSVLLSCLFYIRKRHGVVIATLFVLYAIPRTILELIRVDNPHDVGGLTISQFVSLGMFIGGLASLYMLYKWMPERSPAVAAEASRSKAS